jgi:hypothetical protein
MGKLGVGLGLVPGLVGLVSGLVSGPGSGSGYRLIGPGFRPKSGSSEFPRPDALDVSRSDASEVSTVVDVQI